MQKTSPQIQVSHMFNEISKQYDVVNRILSLGIDVHWRKKIARYLPDKEHLHLLDVATGTCDQLIALMKTGKIESAVGIDLAESMLNIGHKKIIKSPYAKKVHLQVADACKIPFPDDSFDCVSISFGIRNVQGNCLKEMHRVLNSGGTCMILEFSLPKNNVFRTLYLFYLRKILPSLGGWMTKRKTAYSYLNQTIESFPSGERFLELMEKEGFIQCQAIPFTLGVASLYLGEKP